MTKVEIAHTHTLDDIIMAVSFAEAAGDISLIYGDAGLGKTVSLKQYTKMHPDVIYIELKDCDKSVKGVCEKGSMLYWEVAAWNRPSSCRCNHQLPDRHTKADYH